MELMKQRMLILTHVHKNSARCPTTVISLGTLVSISKEVSKMPIFQLFEPANVRGYVHDHDYLEKTQEDIYLESVGLLNISLEKAKGIELRTLGQTKNKLWHEHRSMRITSSHFGRICKATERTDLNKLADELLNPKPFHAKATDHGIKYETEAVRKYEEKLKCKVNQSGLFVSHDFPYLGASPDGITSSGVLLEVKCPYKARGMEITNKTVPYMKKRDNVLLLNEYHNYYYQVQGQLFCTSAQFCDFFVYSIADSKVLRIQRDDKFISSMVAKLQAFYRQFFEPKLLNKHFYNDYRG
ncbi:uncharacterized protein LOC132750479 [Ruditapes philippinarum]|uniref:uncharacterized protein LOC132750479 n=1 Tax=Ruditapes philippinarum TaxID=129788 RepID=UPI00295C07A5|nr:uncharacterized protein LOC132750479 [Ruditapes philippinarum]